MKRPAIFFDRDNTLIVSDGYLGDPAGVVLVEGAADAVARARQLGFATVTFSNQSGVARGYFDEQAVEAVNKRLEELLKAKNPEAVIDRHEFCPYHPDAPLEKYRLDSTLRKPRPGMIFKAADAMALDVENSWVIGDAPRDVAAGQSAGCRTILFTDPTLPPSSSAAEALEREPDARVGTLKGAIDFIEATLHNQIAEDTAPATLGPIYADHPAGSVEAPESSDSIVAPPEVVDSTVDAAPASDESPAAAEITGGTSPPAPVPVAPAIDADALAAAIAREIANLMKGIPTPPSPELASTAVQPASTAKLEFLLDQFLQEFKRSQTPHPPDFSVSKLLAGIVQILAFGALVSVYFLHPTLSAEMALLIAIALQTLTIALLVMGKQH